MPEVLWLNETPLRDWLDTHDGVYGVYKLDTSWWSTLDKEDFLRLIDLLTNDEVEWTNELEEVWVKKGIPRSVLEGRDGEIGGQSEHWNDIWNLWTHDENLKNPNSEVYFYIPRYSDDFDYHGWPDDDGSAKVRRGEEYDRLEPRGNMFVYIPKGLYSESHLGFRNPNTINQNNVERILLKESD